MNLSYPFSMKKTTARFVERKNRFVITAYFKRKIIYCYLPNPGRLWELLIPNETELMLVKNKNSNLPFTVLACKKKDRWVLLHTHLTNRVVESLINHGLIYGGFKVVSEEVKAQRSRFDLLLKNDSEKIYLEIKTCTLFGERIAMFPDAITERGKRHLIELKNLAEKGIKTSVLFVVMNPNIEFFLPAYHIDYEFSKTFVGVKDLVDLKAIALDWDSSLTYVKAVKELKIPFSFIEKILKNGGAYILLIFLKEAETITIGKIRNLNLQPGYYTYVGKAKNKLFKRIKRHRQKIKETHWHIDYLLHRAKIIKDFPIITDRNIECLLARRLSEICDKVIPHFGSSDCRCKSHLFYFGENPIQKREFIELITYFRLDFIEI